MKNMRKTSKQQNNKYGYGVQTFPENNVLVPYSPNSMLYNPFCVFQK
jgi:hypothetical protein